MIQKKFSLDKFPVVVSHMRKTADGPAVLTVDIGQPGEKSVLTGPRLWIERREEAWVVIVHPDDGDPTHKLFLENGETRVVSLESQW